MDQNKRILYRVSLDVLIMLCVALPILLLYLYGEPYKRGFFCDDESLMHPFKESTIKSWMLYLVGLVLPLSVMLFVELRRCRRDERISNGNNTTTRFEFFNYEVPDWVIEFYKKAGVFGFGVAASQLTTDITKYSIGRLRPHFLTVCQPIMKNNATCADVEYRGVYITDFQCHSPGFTERIIKETRLSFPSGHSSFSFFTMVYLAIYVQSRITCESSKLFRHFLQFLFILSALYTALSRVSDYKHHWSDVLAGSVIGVLVAVVVANYVSDLFGSENSKAYVLPHTVQDTTTPHIESSNDILTP